MNGELPGLDGLSRDGKRPPPKGARRVAENESSMRAVSLQQDDEPPNLPCPSKRHPQGREKLRVRVRSASSAPTSTPTRPSRASLSVPPPSLHHGI